MWYRVVVYFTKEAHKYRAESVNEYFATDRDSAWNMWYVYTAAGYKHVEVYDKVGVKRSPEEGIAAL